MKNDWKERDKQKGENLERELADIERGREGESERRGEMFLRVDFSSASSFWLCNY